MFFEFWILDFFENIIIEPKNITRIAKKSSEMNVSQRVDVARYPIFSLNPNSRRDIVKIIKKVFFFKKKTF